MSILAEINWNGAVEAVCCVAIVIAVFYFTNR